MEDAIERMVFGGELVQKESLMVSNVRHIELLEKSRDSLRSAMKMTERKEALDFIEIDVRDAYERLGEITGDTVSEDIINEVFSRSVWENNIGLGNMEKFLMGEYDIIVIGAGHAGCEAGLAAARMGKRLLCFP